MNRRGLIALVVILIAGVITSVYVYKKRQKTEMWTEASQYAIQKDARSAQEFIAPPMINEFEIENPNGKIHLVRKEGRDWIITEPIQTAADSANANAMPFMLATMKINRVVEDNPKNLAVYGLDKPDIKIRYRIKGDPKWRGMDFGRRSPIEGSYYAKDPDKKEIWLTPFSNKFSFNGDLWYYRSKKIFPFNTAESVKVTIKFKDKTFLFQGDEVNSLWRLTTPYEAVAAGDSLNQLLSAMDKSEVLYYFSADELKDKNTGLDSPELEIELTHKKGGVKILVIGAPIGPGQRYAKLSDENQVFLIDTELWVKRVDELCKQPYEGVAFRFHIGAASQIRFEKNGKVLEIVRSKEKKTWTIVGLNEEESDIAKLINSLLVLRGVFNRGYVGTSAKTDAAKFGFDDPSAAIYMTFSEGRTVPEQHIYFGKTDPSGKYVYVYTDSDPFIRLADKKVLNSIPDDPNKFRLRPKKEN